MRTHALSETHCDVSGLGSTAPPPAPKFPLEVTTVVSGSDSLSIASVGAHPFSHPGIPPPCPRSDSCSSHTAKVSNGRLPLFRRSRTHREKAAAQSAEHCGLAMPRQPTTHAIWFLGSL